MSENVQVNMESVKAMLSELEPKHIKKVRRETLKKTASKLVTATRRNLRSVTKHANSRNWWNNKTLQSGVRYRINQDVSEVKIHIMGDYRLIFLEKGTVLRYTTGKSSKSVRGKKPSRRQKRRAYRGKINAKWFFKNARSSTQHDIESEINEEISKAVEKINEKYKNR